VINSYRGVKKFPNKNENIKNISELIANKSTAPRTPKISEYRKAEYNKTK